MSGNVPIININTDDLHNCGKQLGFLCAEFIEGFTEGVAEYYAAREAARKDEEKTEAGKQASAEDEKE